ncbi:MAG: hypothetical protein PHV77_04995 [Candidatus Omnitrophica bacterium]|nr:hypothetical protein [Candidatus Omnitrophota bacterium]
MDALSIAGIVFLSVGMGYAYSAICKKISDGMIKIITGKGVEKWPCLRFGFRPVGVK